MGDSYGRCSWGYVPGLLSEGFAPIKGEVMTAFTLEDYLAIIAGQKEIIRCAERAISLALELAWDCPLPEKLRRVDPSDLIEGAIFWYPDANLKKWFAVDKVEGSGVGRRYFWSDGQVCDAALFLIEDKGD
jgi:hypothetical protein